MSYRCEHCAAEFDRPEPVTEWDYIDTGIGLEWHEIPIGECCPECGREEFTELTEEAEL